MEYIVELSGDRKSALAIAAKILAKWQAHAKVQKEGAAETKLQFIACIIKYISVALDQNKATHYDVYCDVLEQLLPNGAHEPCANPELWSKALKSLRFIHYHIALNQLKEANRICKCLAEHSKWMHREGDYKVLLSIYCQQLLALKAENNNYDDIVQMLLTALTQLFKEMLRCNQSDAKFLYPDLITDFLENLFKNRSKNTQVFICSLPAPALQTMLNAFFELLVKMHLPDLKDIASTNCLKNIDALQIFLQIDLHDQLKWKLSVSHLRAIRNQPVIKNDVSMEYFVSLLYYFTKFLYERTKQTNFEQTQHYVLGKLTQFLQAHGKSLIEHLWFMNGITILYIMLTNMQPRLKGLFDIYWQQMQNLEVPAGCYAGHLELTFECIRLMYYNTNCTLLKSPCCKSLRKHAIFNLGLYSLQIYAQYLQNVNSQLVDESSETLKKHMWNIMHYTVEVFAQMSCVDASSKESSKLSNTVSQLLQACQIKWQCKFAIQLAEMLCKVREKISKRDWLILLRCVYKTAEVSQDFCCISNSLGLYIAALLLEHKAADCNRADIRLTLGQFYRLLQKQENEKTAKCLLELLEQSKSNFKLDLSTKHKRMLYWLELDQYHTFRNEHKLLRSSLMRCSANDYELVLVLHAQSEKAVKNTEVIEQLEKLYNQLSNKKEDELKRLDHLVYAHTCTLMLLSLQLGQTCDLEGNECTEEELTNLFSRPNVAAINIKFELKKITFLEKAIASFKMFFELASEQPISSVDTLIDWQTILKDLMIVARTLHYAGYMEHATKAWLLHYEIAEMLQDDLSIISSLSYFCEQTDMLVGNECIFNLEAELRKHSNTLARAEMRLKYLSKHKQHSLLICYCQMAYYHSRKGRLNWARALLAFSRQLHSSLNQEVQSYDIMLATADVVQFRIYWKHLVSKEKYEQYSQAERAFHAQSLMSVVNNLLDQILAIQLSSNDNLIYQILLLELVLQFAECAANRLCGNFLQSYFVVLIKVNLQTGNVLRLVQLLTVWMWTNLQMEHVDKAQIKLQVIHSLMGLQSMKELKQELPKNLKSAVKCTDKIYLNPYSQGLLKNNVGGLEMVRRVVSTQLSPVTVNTQLMFQTEVQAQLEFMDLVKGRNDDNINALLQQCEAWQWAHMSIRCMQARLCFIAADYKPLQQFYEESWAWFGQQQKSLLKQKHQSLQLLLAQHYANYMRTEKKFTKALEFIKQTFVLCNSSELNVDPIYSINMWQQFLVTSKEITNHLKKRHICNDKICEIRRALSFDLSPEEDKKQVVPKPMPKPKSKKAMPTIFVDSPECTKSVIDLNSPDIQKDCNENTSPNKDAIESTVATTTRKTTRSKAAAAASSEKKVANTPKATNAINTPKVNSEVPNRRLRRFRI